MNRFLILLALIALVIVTGRGSMASPAGGQNLSRLRPPAVPQASQAPAETRESSPLPPGSEESQWVSDQADPAADTFSILGKRLRDGSLLP